MHKNIKLLYIFNFLLDFRLYAAVIILYFTKITGSFTLGMSIFSVTMVSSAFFELPTGIVSDIVGRKKTVVLGSIMSVFALTFYAIGGTYIALFFGALCEGASRAFFSGNNDALLYESLKENKHQEMFPHYSGKTSSLSQIALGVASLLGGFIATFSFPFVMWLSILPQIGCFIMSLFIQEPLTEHTKETNIYAHLKEAFKQFNINRKLRLLSISSIVREAIGEVGFLFRPAFISMLWPVWAIGLSATGSFIIGSFGYYISGTIVKKFSALPTLFGEIVINRVITFFAILFPTIVSPVLLSFTSLFYGPGDVAMGTLLQREFTNEQRATLGSLNSFGAKILFGIAAVGIGFIADVSGPVTALVITNCILLTTLYFYMQIFKHDKSIIPQTVGNA